MMYHIMEEASGAIVENCDEYGVRSAVDCLYGDLDTGNRDKLVARALECYDGMKEIK